MANELHPASALCVRQTPLLIADAIGRSIAPILAEKLAALPLLASAKSEDGTRFERKRITVEFFYERTNENPWGDFAIWNIIETEVHGKTVTTTKHHFPERAP
jgi:hypothetical protein